MKMRKLMAAVLAVVIAISAMAVTVFADDAEVVKIPLYADHTDYSTNRVETFTFTLPIYNLYGYANQDSYIEFNLPTSLTNDANRTYEIRYYMEVNGNRYQMRTERPVAGGTGYAKQYVNFGAFAHPYYNDESWTTIPQTVNFNEITSLSLIAEVVINNPQPWEGSVTLNTWDFNKDNTKVNQMYAQLWTAGANGIKDYNDGDPQKGDDQLVTGSILYCWTMGVTKSEGSYSSNYNKYSFLYNYPKDAKQEYKAINTTLPQYNVPTPSNPILDAEKNWEENILTWDHTLQNKMYALNAVSAKIVVELASPYDWESAGRTNGTAFYMLGTVDAVVDHDMLNNSSLWWQYSQRDDKWISTCIVNNENVTQLAFDVPVDRLYNAMYGSGTASIFNGGFKVFAQYEAPEASFADAWNRGYSHLALNAYLELTLPAEEETPDIVIEDPVQAGDSDEETDGADDVTVTDPEDTNPSTGIVLAVLPMVAAAAAIVASKRR